MEMLLGKMEGMWTTFMTGGIDQISEHLTWKEVGGILTKISGKIIYILQCKLDRYLIKSTLLAHLS